MLNTGQETAASIALLIKFEINNSIVYEWKKNQNYKKKSEQETAASIALLIKFEINNSIVYEWKKNQNYKKKSEHPTQVWL